METRRENKARLPRGIKLIYLLDGITFFLLLLGLFGVLIPTLIVPQPLTPGRIGGGVAGVSVIGAFMLLTIIAVIGVIARRNWGKIFHTIYSVIMLLAIPLGTILQGFALYYLYRDPAVKTYFERKPPAPPEERKAA